MRKSIFISGSQLYGRLQVHFGSVLCITDSKMNINCDIVCFVQPLTRAGDDSLRSKASKETNKSV